MAESLDRKQNNSAVDDDMIRDALKSGLSSIKASDFLVDETLLKCQEEIAKGKREKKSKSFIPWVLRLGTPLAAGALVLVLIINIRNLGMKGSSSPDMAPQASASGAMGIRSMENETGLMEAPVPSAADTKSPEPQEDIGKKFGFAEDAEEGIEPVEKYADSEEKLDEENNGNVSDGAGKEEGDVITDYPETLQTTAKITVLRSSAKREPGIREASLAELVQPFKEIVNIYNQANETELILKEETILRISSLVKEGVSAQMLNEANDYNDILSDEGYWALPLIDENGGIEKVLTVCFYDQDEPEEVSSPDIIYTIDKKKYIVSELAVGDDIGTELKELLSEILYSLGDIDKSGMVIIDINNGTDFIAIVDIRERKAIVPLLINDGIFGLKNNNIYNWAMFKQSVSQSLEQ